MIIDKLKTAQKSHALISVYANPAKPDFYSVGHVVHVDRSILIMHAIDPNGFHDGVIVRLRRYITQVDETGIYEEKLALLHSKYKNVFARTEIPPGARNLRNVLTWAKRENLIVSTRIKHRADASPISGYVAKLTKSDITLYSINDYGVSSGNSTVSISSIVTLDIDGIEEQQIGFLHRKTDEKLSTKSSKPKVRARK